MRTKRTGIRVHAPIGEPVRTVVSLDGEWAMKPDPANAGMAEGWAARPLETELRCSVPGCVQAVGELAQAYPSLTGMPNGYLGTVWLERLSDIPAEASGKQLWLKLGGVAPAAHVWLDGQYVGYHSHAPISAKWNITDLAVPGRTARITAAIVEEDKGMLGGLRFGELFWSGLYRSAELEISEAVTVEDVQLRPDPAAGTLRIAGRICNAGPEPARVMPEAAIGPWEAGPAGTDGRLQRSGLPAAGRGRTDRAESGAAPLGGTQRSEAERAASDRTGRAGTERTERTEREWTARGAAVLVEAGGETGFAMTVELPQARLWSCEEPNLYTAAILLRDAGIAPGADSIKSADGGAEVTPEAKGAAAPSAGRVVDGLAHRFGMRSFVADGASLKLNGKPFMARGTGQEYFSPTIGPLTDRELIAARFRSIRGHGFNFVRYHTYTPTQEELDAADECGLLLVSEIGLVSNFGKTFPFPEGLRVLEEHVVQTRNHPSLAVYCLGNEGSQLMVHIEREREHAAAGYETIKRLAPDHPAMIAFGLQGELPEMANDIESPHLWSHEFRLAYDALSAIPWKLLGSLASAKPCVVHEYGKFGVWPDEREESLYPAGGYSFPFGRKGREALEAAGLGSEEERIIANSRKLSYICNRSAIEQARRQPGMDGYVMWTFFRHGSRNAGFVDDMGLRPDHDPKRFGEGCNAPLAVLIDRDCDKRTLQAGEWVDIGVHLSNFAGEDLSDATIRWRFAGGDGKPVVSGELTGISCLDGVNVEVGRIVAAMPVQAEAGKLTLAVEVVSEARVAAAGDWEFWTFPLRREESPALVVYDFADAEFGRQFRSRVPGAIRVLDYDSALRGCRSWNGPDLAASLELQPPDLFVTDRPGEEAALFLRRGVKVLLLDSGHFPRQWLPEPYPPGPAAFDYHRQFTSFRAGWDRGNIATVVADDPLLAGFPHEGFCDAQFYWMIQDADPLRTWAVAETAAALAGDGLPPSGGGSGQSAGRGGAVGDRVEAASGRGGAVGERAEAASGGGGTGCDVIVRSVPRLQSDDASSVVLQDPNARNEQRKWVLRQIATEDRGYLLRVAAGAGTLIVCSLRLFADPAGGDLLGRLLRNALAGDRAEEPALSASTAGS